MWNGFQKFFHSPLLMKFVPSDFGIQWELNYIICQLGGTLLLPTYFSSSILSLKSFTSKHSINCLIRQSPSTQNPPWNLPFMDPQKWSKSDAGHAISEPNTAGIQERGSHNVAQGSSCSPIILSLSLPASTTFPSCPSQPSGAMSLTMGHASNINHPCSTLSYPSGTPPQTSAILNQGSMPDKMVVPMPSSSANKTILVNKVDKPCYSNSNPNVVALSCPSSAEGDLSSPDNNEQPEDIWDKVWKAAIREGDWQMVSKFTVPPVWTKDLWGN